MEIGAEEVRSDSEEESVRIPGPGDLESAGPPGARVALYLVPASDEWTPHVITYCSGTRNPNTPMKAHNKLWAFVGTYPANSVGDLIFEHLTRIRPELDRLARGYSGPYWDGQNNVGSWEADDLATVQQAWPGEDQDFDPFEGYASPEEDYAHLSRSEIFDFLGMTADTTDEELTLIADGEVKRARECDMYFRHSDVYHCLQELRDAEVDEDDEEEA